MALPLHEKLLTGTLSLNTNNKQNISPLLVMDVNFASANLPNTNAILKDCVCKIMIIEPRREKTGYCICENKDADQLRGNREADQRLCFRHTDSAIPLLPKSEVSSL